MKKGSSLVGESESIDNDKYHPLEMCYRYNFCFYSTWHEEYVGHFKQK